MYSEEEGRINQVLLKNSSLENQDLTNKLSKSICKIETNNFFSTGFLIKLKKGESDSYFLITNEHAITKRMIKSNEKIKFYYDNINNKNKFINLELNKNERFIRTYDYMNIDACLIQILPSDNIDKSYFLQTPKLDYINKYEQFKNKQIIIFQFPLGGILNTSSDKIIDINLPRYELYYKASTQLGSSGSPIFLENSGEVIGIHKQGGRNTNVGNFLGPIILSLENDHEYVENNNINGNGIYEGEINKNNMREGFGKYIYKNENYYIGQWLNDKKYGIGIEYNKNNKIIYEGEFVNNKYDGEGTQYYEKGGKYKGHWENGNKNGKGEEYDKNKIQRYIGNFRNNQYSGYGSCFDENGNLEYDGNWENHKKNGIGKKYYMGYKIEYDGYFIDDIFHGNGIYYNENQKVIYDGQWKNGKRNGKGKKYSGNKENKLEYKGEFVNNDYDGEGISYYKNGNIEYNGTWKNDNKSGKGKQYYDNKGNTLKYDGEFENNEYCGKGTSFYKNGNKEYEGNWKNNKKNGKGKKYYENEIDKFEYEGEFFDDQFHGDGITYYKNGNKEYDGTWKNNKKEGSGIEYFNNKLIKSRGIYKNGELYDGQGSKYENGKVLKYILKQGQRVKQSCFG